MMDLGERAGRSGSSFAIGTACSSPHSTTPSPGTARTLSLLEARLTDLGITPGAQTRQIAASLLGTGPAPHRRAEPG